MILLREEGNRIDKENDPGFIALYQRSILLSLVKRNVLSPSACERCLAVLEAGVFYE